VKGGGGVEKFSRRFADIGARRRSALVSISGGLFDPRGGLRQDSCAYLCLLSRFYSGDYLCVIGVPDFRGGHWAAVVNWERATESRV
jgi:hypothetical protein